MHTLERQRAGDQAQARLEVTAKLKKKKLKKMPWQLYCIHVYLFKIAELSCDFQLNDFDALIAHSNVSASAAAALRECLICAPVVLTIRFPGMCAATAHSKHKHNNNSSNNKLSLVGISM